MCGGDKLYFFWRGVEKQTRMQIVGAFLQHLSVGASIGVVRPQIIVYTGPGIYPDFADVGKYCDPTAFTDAVTFGKDQLSLVWRQVVEGPETLGRHQMKRWGYRLVLWRLRRRQPHF